jgi:site-specific recombinase XerD
VHGLLPKSLADRLEEYRRDYRPLLINNSDPGTLFLNDDGQGFSARGLQYLMANVTARYVGRSVNPHFFRNIFAVKYLEERPEDYLTLSKILWHRNISATIGLYARKFDESHGARRAEEWQEARKKRKK